MKEKILTEKLAEIDESFREIDGLADLYQSLIGEGAADKQDLDIRQDEARFARDRLLRLSLHVKNVVQQIETKELLR